MTAQKVPSQPPARERRLSARSSAESFPVSPGYLAAAQVVDLDNTETPHREPPESSFKTPQKSRERHSQDRGYSPPLRRSSRSIHLTPKATDSMHKALESRALKRQEEDDPEEDDLADPAP
ncbi:hypothetical protein FIBSPDRAFT_963331 [Athelia psychrophila]|uniref:Uncharacterized protein n=1 Tax=Athelia psychrophila TaxID=1759441 RepID=A0A165Z1Y4_9AGAM|nr:hypothetical protein FIBSPDRAFT_963331 [Fibularhizoctonia sp. CBS 109695]